MQQIFGHGADIGQPCEILVFIILKLTAAPRWAHAVFASSMFPQAGFAGFRCRTPSD
jgi:hypothetical protein